MEEEDEAADGLGGHGTTFLTSVGVGDGGPGDDLMGGAEGLGGMGVKMSWQASSDAPLQQFWEVPSMIVTFAPKVLTMSMTTS